MKIFEETGAVTRIKGPVHHRFTRSAKKIAIVSDQELRISLDLRLHLHPYKVQHTLQLKLSDHSQRRRYNFFLNKIFFGDELLFTLSGYVSKQNSHIWGFKSPQVIEESPLHPENVTVWCALWAEGVIGHYFL